MASGTTALCPYLKAASLPCIHSFTFAHPSLRGSCPPCPAALAGTVHIASARMPPSASGTRQQEEAKQLQDSTSHADSHYFLTVPCRYQDVTGTDLLANKGRPSCCTAERSRAQPEPRHRSQADGGRGGLRLCLEALLGNTTGRRCRCHPCCTIRPRHPQLRAVALRA